MSPSNLRRCSSSASLSNHRFCSRSAPWTGSDVSSLRLPNKFSRRFVGPYTYLLLREEQNLNSEPEKFKILLRRRSTRLHFGYSWPPQILLDALVLIRKLVRSMEV